MSVRRDGTGGGDSEFRPARLSVKELRFVDAYLGSANANGTQAARQAGYGSTQKSSQVAASRLLSKAIVWREIDAMQFARSAKAILDADARDILLSQIARDATADVRDRIRAICELNKCTGRHSIKHTHAGKFTLAEALEASRNL